MHTIARRGRAHRLPRRGVAVYFVCSLSSQDSSVPRLGRLGWRGTRGRVGANDELCVPDTSTRQSAANAVLKSASNNCENVGEPGSLAMTKRADGHDSLRDGSVVKRSRCLELGPTQMTQILLCTPVFELSHGRRRARLVTTTCGRERWGTERGACG